MSAPAPRLFLTVDAGGTSTRAVVHTRDGDCLGYAVAGGGNPSASGVAAVVREIDAAAGQALDRAGTGGDRVGSALAAMAGSSSGGSGVEWALRGRGITVPLHLGNDLAAMFSAGTSALDGVVAVAGTGAGALAMRAGRPAARTDGRGWLLGDVGSGFWIARRVLRAVVADLDHRGPRTALTAPTLAAVLGPSASRELGAADQLEPEIDQLVRAVYAIQPPGIARFAPLAFEFAAEDEVAGEIVDSAAAGLAHTITALGSLGTGEPLVVGGSVLYRQGGFRQGVVRRVRETGWTGSATATADGLLGAICMNLRSAGVAIDERAHHRIGHSLLACRGG